MLIDGETTAWTFFDEDYPRAEVVIVTPQILKEHLRYNVKTRTINFDGLLADENTQNMSSSIKIKLVQN